MTATSNLQKMATDPALFRSALLIDTDAGRKRLGDVLDDWQRSDFEVLDPAWLAAVGRGPAVEDGATRSYLERPRGHSKSTDLAVMATWALAFAPRKIAGAAAAASRDQARLLRDAIDRLVRANPWLAETLDVQQYRVVNTRTGSTLEILAADYQTNYGLLLDFLVIDELTHWRAGGEDLWHALISAVAKRRHCVCCVISNAGFGQGNSWQWKVREAVRDNASWHFSRLDGPRASWITEGLLAEQAALLPPAAYKRLWLNQWTAGEGDCLDAQDIERAITRRGPLPSRTAAHRIMVGSFDLGYRRDRSAFVVLAGNGQSGRISLAHCESWSPRAYGGKLPLDLIRQSVLEAHGRFKLDGVAFDPHQAIYLAEELTAAGLRMVEVWPSAANHDAMCKVLLQAFQRQTVDLYRDEQLIQDLQALSVVEKQSGLRLVAARDSTGHADTAVAFAMGLTLATQWLAESSAPVSFEHVAGTLV